MLTFEATIPTSPSAFKIGGDQGDSIRLMLEMNLTGDQIQSLLALRGQVIKVTLE